jgi:hypothetical protein
VYLYGVRIAVGVECRDDRVALDASGEDVVVDL